MKTCKRCDAAKPLAEFPKEARSRDGHNRWCRSCHAAYRLANIERERERHRGYQQDGRQDEWNRAFRERNREKLRESQGRWRMGNIDSVRDTILRRQYQMTLEDYRALLAAQGGGCAVCGATEPGGGAGSNIDGFSVDHDHSCCPGKVTCGKCVRALLCNRCNLSIGRLGDSLDVFRRIVEVMENPPAQQYRRSLDLIAARSGLAA